METKYHVQLNSYPVLSRPQVDLAFLRFLVTRGNWKTQAHTGGLFVALSNNRCFSDQLEVLGRQRIHFHGNRRLNAGVEHALVEQLTFFFESKHCSRRLRHTQVDFMSPRKNADNRTETLSRCKRLKTQERKVDLWPALCLREYRAKVKQNNDGMRIRLEFTMHWRLVFIVLNLFQIEKVFMTLFINDSQISWKKALLRCTVQRC